MDVVPVAAPFAARVRMRSRQTGVSVQQEARKPQPGGLALLLADGPPATASRRLM